MRKQYDVIAHCQLLECGWSAARVVRAVAVGDLDRIYKGVYIEGGAPVRPESRLIGACLVGKSGVASHRSSAWLWDLTDRPFVEITRSASSNPTLPGCVVHRTDATPSPVVRKGIPCTNPLRTVVDLAAVVKGDELWLPFATGVSRRLVTPEGVRAEHERLRGRGRHGSAAIDGMLAELGPVSLRSPSVLQMAFARLVVRQGLEWPEPEVPATGTRYRVDYAYRDVLLAIELNGFDPHGDPIAAADAYRRERALMSLGWTVLPFAWNDVWNHPERTAAEIRTHLTRLRAA